MNINYINVPENIDYLSEWPGFSLPQGHSIIDKTLCGCGFTEYCLTNPQNVILCSPRKILLENKKEQHPENFVYYFKNEADGGENYDLETVSLGQDKAVEQSYLVSLKSSLRSWYNSIRSYGPAKILVTYDSLHHVLDALGQEALDFHIVTDEFQAIFVDSSFKANVELGFMGDLQNFPNVSYVSATPMLEKYLDMIDYFKSMPFYKLVWPENKVESIRIKREVVRSINLAVGEYIENYRNGNFEKKVVDGKIYESRELTIFCNSLKSICTIIKKYKLTPAETNVLCARTPENEARLKKLKHSIGKVPLKGEAHKMFTFCTRTVYLGADFYSTCAYTIICSDCNIRTLTIDISLDLPQILGRQRLRENVFRNEVLFLYRAENKAQAIINLSEEKFKDVLEKKDAETRALLKAYSSYDNNDNEESKTIQLALVNKFYRDKEPYFYDFVGFSRDRKPCINYLVRISNLRAWDVSRKDYQDLVTIRRGMESLGYQVEDNNGNRGFSRMDPIISDLMENIDKEADFEDKMRLLCNSLVNNKSLLLNYKDILSALIPRNLWNYIELLGPEKILYVGCYESAIKNLIKNPSLGQPSPRKQRVAIPSLEFPPELVNCITNMFTVGKRYSLKFIKSELESLYTNKNFARSPKASDLGDIFDLKKTKIEESGVWVNGYEILKKKQ